LEAATKWLGLTKSIVVDLIRAGLLTAEPYPDQVGDRPWLFSKRSLDECYREVTRGVIRGVGYSRLAEAARTLSVVGLKVADILKLVAQEKLHCWAPTEAPALAQLSFDRSEIEAVLENPQYGKGLLRSEHAACRLGVEWSTFFHWTRTGLFSSVVTYAHDAYFDPDEIDGFLADHITSQEAAEMLEADVVELEGWYFEWGLEAVKGVDLDGRTLCLFHRKDMKRVMAIEAKKVGQNKNI
jgi:hypothetical protein